MRDSFVFYRSFYEAINELDSKRKLIMYDTIIRFALFDEEPKDLDNICKAIFILIKPQIVANNKRYENGKKGGRPKKNKTIGFEEDITTGYEEE